MVSADQDLSPEVQQLIESVIRARARMKIPAVVVRPSDDPDISRAALSKLCESAASPELT